MIRVRDLPERPAYRVALYCPSCCSTYSATRGDYFLASPDKVMTCCSRQLRLTRERTTHDEITPAEASR